MSITNVEPLVSNERWEEVIARFNEKWEPVTESGCWIWTGAAVPLGYGYLRITLSKNYSKSFRAPRLSWEIHCGQIPENLIICHACDNPTCVNPSHLFLGAHKDNSGDMSRKGRHKIPNLRGENHPRAKVSACDVETIRRRYADGEMNQYELAETYGIAQSSVWAIIARRSHS